VAEHRVHVWCEDRGHESVVRALVERIAKQLGVRVDIETKTGEGGAGRAITEFKAWQRAVQRGLLGGTPDLVIVVVDANSVGARARHAELQGAIIDGIFPHVAIGCPDPHIEAWLLLDVAAFRLVTGSPPLAHQPRPGEDHKALYQSSVAASGIPLLTGPMELAPDIIARMEIDKMAAMDRSLASFLSDVRAALRRLA
jgi:hypothetical protein